MQNTKFIFHNLKEFGGHAITIPAFEAGFTIDMVLEKDVAGIADEYVVLDQLENNILLIHTFIGAHSIVDGELHCDMTKAKEIKVDNIRIARDIKFSALDKDFMIALEKGDSAEIDAIKALKEELRDLPETIMNQTFETLEDLNSFIPECLK